MKIVAIGAHADDVEIGCGGVLAKAERLGHEAHIVIATRPSEHIRPLFQEEASKAAHLLGAELHTLYFDQAVYQLDRFLVGAIEEIITSVNPDIVFTVWRHDTHQDHAITNRATLAACRNAKRVLAMEGTAPPARMAEHEFKARAYISISEEDLNMKLRAIAAHESQFERYGGTRWLDVIRARATVRGAETREEYAEAFDVAWMEVEL